MKKKTSLGQTRRISMVVIALPLIQITPTFCIFLSFFLFFSFLPFHFFLSFLCLPSLFFLYLIKWRYVSAGMYAYWGPGDVLKSTDRGQTWQFTNLNLLMGANQDVRWAGILLFYSFLSFLCLFLIIE